MRAPHDRPRAGLTLDVSLNTVTVAGSDASSAVRRTIARQYDRFQSSLESLNRERKFLNYGYTVSSRDSLESRQAQLCLEVFAAAAIEPSDVIVDVGFGSGEQDFLLARTLPFRRLIGFNIAERQVRYARERARRERLDERLEFRHGEAETLPGLDAASADKLLAIECAFYFDRPRFYERAARVLKTGGRAVIADIALAGPLAWLVRGADDLRRVGSPLGNRALWERHFHTRSIVTINRQTRPGAQMSVAEILRTIPFAPIPLAERGEWLKMAFYSQLVALGLLVNLVRYDLIVLEKK